MARSTEEKIAAARRKWRKKIEPLTPLEYMLKIMNKPSVPGKQRDAMARAALPYCHAKLKPVASPPPPDPPPTPITDDMTLEEVLKHFDALRRRPYTGGG